MAATGRVKGIWPEQEGRERKENERQHYVERFESEGHFESSFTWVDWIARLRDSRVDQIQTTRHLSSGRSKIDDEWPRVANQITRSVVFSCARFLGHWHGHHVAHRFAGWSFRLAQVVEIEYSCPTAGQG